MAGLDRVLDPKTRDYVADAAGSTETTRNASTAIYHQMTTILNTWWGDSDAGIERLRLEQARIKASTPEDLIDIFSKPLQPLIDAARITAPSIVTAVDVAGEGGEVDVTVEDLQTREDLPVTVLAPYNP